jgi:hypothetical protein
MNTRRAAGCLAALLILWSAPAAQAEDNQQTQPAADQVQTLQSEISNPADFQNFVEGSHRLPASTAVPRAQLWPQSSGQTTAKKTPLSPALPKLSLERESIPPAPAYVDHTPAPVSDNLPKYPLKGLALFSLAAAGLFALNNKREFAAEASPTASNATVPTLDKPTPPAPETSITETPATHSLLAKLEAPVEPFIDTLMPVPTWLAISWREQRLIETWDASSEKALGKASFEEWLDAQASLEGVDAAMLKAKLCRDI